MTALMRAGGKPAETPYGVSAESTAETVLRRATTMFELNIKHDIDRYSPDTRQDIQNHNRRVAELKAMVMAIRHLEKAETQLKAAGQFAHCESVTWTADKLDITQHEARQFIRSTGYDIQQQIWREDLAIESADYKEAQA